MVLWLGPRAMAFRPCEFRCLNGPPLTQRTSSFVVSTWLAAVARMAAMGRRAAGGWLPDRGVQGSQHAGCPEPLYVTVSMTISSAKEISAPKSRCGRNA